VHGLDVEKAEAGLFTPVEECRGRAVVSFTRVRVADLGGAGFDEATAAVRTARGDRRRLHGIACSFRNMAGNFSGFHTDGCISRLTHYKGCLPARPTLMATA